MSHFIITHPNTPSVPVYNEQLRAGNMNGIERQTMHKLININSNIREEQAPPISSSNAKYRRAGSVICPSGNLCPTETVECSTTWPCNTCKRCCYLKKWNSSNFIVRLPTTLDKVVSVKLSAMEIPNTIYTISSSMKTNVFQVVSETTCTPVELPAGNYKVDQLVLVINNILNKMDGSGCIGCSLQANYDSISGRFYFYSNTPGFSDSSGCCGLDFRLPDDDRDIKLNLGWLLGFRKAVYCCDEYVDADQVWALPNGNKIWPCRNYTDCGEICVTMEDAAPGVWDIWPHGYMAEGMLDITGPRYLFLIVNDFNNNTNNKYTSLISSAVNFSASNILARISMPYGKNEIGYDDTADLIPKIREYFGPVSIEKLHIQVVDEMGRIVDFNNNDISLLLDFQCLYNL